MIEESTPTVSLAMTGWARRKSPTTGRIEVEVEPGRWVSRQRAWQVLQALQGRCGKCGRPREHYPFLCDLCAERVRAYRRKQRGLNPWSPGNPGRPPKTYNPPEAA